jgi:hypothetical protein
MSEVFTQGFRDRTENKVIFRRVQDCEPIIEANKRLQNTPQKSDWGRHIASIPCVIIEKWCNDEGVNFLKMGSEEFGLMVKRKLRDPDWKWLRTTDGSI